jgi:hypothetical protein
VKTPTKLRLIALILLACGASFCPSKARAQNSTAGSGSLPGGGYSWQVDQGTTTTTFTGSAQFNVTQGHPSGPQIAVNIHNSTSIHEVHGNITLVVPNAGVNGSIVMSLLGDGGNVIASAKMQKFGTGAVTLPVSGTFPTALSAGSFSWRFYVDIPGVQIINVSLVMN